MKRSRDYTIVALLLVLAIALLASCSLHSRTQVMYMDGEVRWVDNDNNVPVIKGDTIITAKLMPAYGSAWVYGKFIGQLPKITFDSTGGIFYQKAVVITSN